MPKGSVQSQNQRAAALMLIGLLLIVPAFWWMNENQLEDVPLMLKAEARWVRDLCYNGRCFKEVSFGRLQDLRVIAPVEADIKAGDLFLIEESCNRHTHICHYTYSGKDVAPAKDSTQGKTVRH